MQQCPSLIARHISSTPVRHSQYVKNQEEEFDQHMFGFESGGEDDGSTFLMLWCWKGGLPVLLPPQPMKIGEGCCCF